MNHKRFWISGVLMLLSTLTACNLAVNPPANPTAFPSPVAVQFTQTPSPVPTATPIPSLTPTPAPTLTPSITPVPSATFTPTATPYPIAPLANDQYTLIDLPPALRDGVQGVYFAIASVNERTGGASNPKTPQPDLEVETLYLVNPANGQLIEIMDIPATADAHIYWSPDGMKFVYFLEPVQLADGTLAGGLYLVNLELGLGVRLFNLPTLNPRGIPNHRPVWSPDSSQFAIAMPTAYDVDIFVISDDGSLVRNVTQHGAFDFWPSWSPDGVHLAFVSDRNECPTWQPSEPNTCSRLVSQAAPDEFEGLLGEEQQSSIFPRGGHVFVLNVETGDTRQVSEVWVDSPPTWISQTRLAVTTGLSDSLATETEIWLLNVQAGTARRVSGQAAAFNFGAAWSPDGGRVVYYRASEPAGVVLHDLTGAELAVLDRYLFSRYGFAADWSPDGQWIAFGGRNSQCPYGLIVTRESLSVFFAGTTPRACDPVYSPDGQWLAYAGIQTRAGAADGRLDLFVAQPNGYGARNLTSRLKGEVVLLGWVGTP